MKKIVRLTESELVKLVNKVLKEQSKGTSSNPVKIYDDSEETKFLDTAFVVGPGKMNKPNGDGDAIFPAMRIGNIKGELRIDCQSPFHKFYFFENNPLRLTLNGYNKIKSQELCSSVKRGGEPMS